MSVVGLDRDRLSAGETDLLGVPRGGGRGRPAVILLPGAGDTAATYTTDPSLTRLVRALVRAGHVVVAVAPTGPANWGRPSTAPIVDAAVALAAQHGAHPTLVALQPISMGDLVAMTYIRLRPGRVLCVGGIQPACDLNDLRNRDVFGVARAQIDAALGVTWPAPLPQHASPLGTGTAALINVGLARPGAVRFWYSEADDVTRPQYVRALATALGGTATKVSDTLNHSDDITNLVPTADLVRFFDQHTRRVP